MVEVLNTRIDFRDMHFDVQKGYVKFGGEAL